MPEPPPTLYVFAPSGPHPCPGEYRLLQETSHSHPVWKQASGSFWLHSQNGKWIISETPPKEMEAARGVLFCKELHNGRTPDQLRGLWVRLDEGGTFCEDSDITVTSTIRLPRELRLVSPNGRENCVGEYRRLMNFAANGMPVWMLKTGSFWLYSGTNGCWIVGGVEIRNEEFNCSRGVIYSQQPHGGAMPDEVGGVWMRLSSNKGAKFFLEDSSIKVFPLPPTLYVNSPKGQACCAGEYFPVPGKVVNHQPLWQHVNGKCWLYSSTNNVWVIGGTDARDKDFHCNRGVICCRKLHGGNPPHVVQGGWLRLDGSVFCEDPTITVGRNPTSLHVICPRGQKRCAGVYDLQDSQLRGYPVWKQRRGERSIFSDENGSWQVGHEGLEEESCLISQRPHRGSNPDKVAGSWAVVEDGSALKDPEVQVVSCVEKPPRLFISSPHAHQRCAGEYVLCPGDEANEQPVWKQQAGKFWLYSGTNGMWIVGGNSAKDVSFNCSRGLIHCGQPHGGLLPDRVPGPWQRLDGQTWLVDTDVAITARPPGEEAL